MKSTFRGEVGLGTDLDLLVFMPSERTGAEWMQLIYEVVHRPVACDILAYNEEEFQQMLPSSRFLRRILQEGKIVYEASRPPGSAAVADPGPG